MQIGVDMGLASGWIQLLTFPQIGVYYLQLCHLRVCISGTTTFIPAPELPEKGWCSKPDDKTDIDLDTKTPTGSERLGSFQN